MKSILISILALQSFSPAGIFASLLSTPTVTSTAITTAAVPACSSSFLLRNGLRDGDPREEPQATRTSGMSGVNEPSITSAPTAEEIKLQERYHLTTYWSCVTLQTYVHCGWHEPVVAGGTEIAGALCGSCSAGRVAMVAAGVAMAAGAIL